MFHLLFVLQHIGTDLIILGVGLITWRRRSWAKRRAKRTAPKRNWCAHAYFEGSQLCGISMDIMHADQASPHSPMCTLLVVKVSYFCF